ncbi:ligand-binding sensor domain-containing diguanylate cyclase [Silanimonas algicola]
MERPFPPRRGIWTDLLMGAALLAWGGTAAALSEDRRFSDFAIDNWTVADGLPQVAVQSVAQDGDGYLWVGTQSSIARFDGVRFEPFDRRRTGGIDTSMAESSYRSRDGDVWFANRTGALRIRGDRVTRVAAAGTGVAVQSITEWPAGRMLFGTARGLYERDGDTLVPAGLEGMDIGALVSDGPVLWIGARGRLLRREGERTRSIPLPGGEDLRITHLLPRGATLWIGTPRGLWRMSGDAAPEPFTPVAELGRLPIETLCADSGGSLWISTAPRLYRLRSNGVLDAIQDSELVRNPWVNTCLEDREGNLWLGSQTESLFRVWDGLVSRLTEADGLEDPFVWSLEDDGRGGVLVGTNSGLSRWHDGRTETLVPGTALPDAAVYELARLPDDRLWIGTRGGLRERLNGRLGMPPGAEALEGVQVNVIAPSTTAIWVGTNDGLYRSTTRQGLRPVGEGAFEGTAMRVRALLPLDDDRALVGTEDGLRYVDGAQVSVPDWARDLRGRMVTSLLRLPSGLLVAGTLDSGLTLVAGERAIRLDEGLPTLNAWTLRTHEDWLYVSSIEGLYRLPLAKLPDPATTDADAAHGADVGASWVLSMAGRNQSGQRARCCNGGARSRALMVGGQLWLPSISGVLRVDLGAIGSSGTDPLVHVESAMLGDRRHSPDAGTLVLDGELRDLRFDFTALHFRSPRAMRFEYRLDGYDRDWIDAGERRSAFYTNLPPGDFRFRVRARDEFGKSVQAGNPLDVRVEPRWTERPAIRGLGLAAGLLLLAAGMMLGQRRQRLRTERLQALVDERTAQWQRANERLAQANAVLAVESQTDALTGLPNRRAVFQQMPTMLARHPEGVVLALVDIDHFKRVNDDYGHAAGDTVLRDFAAFLRRATREGDLLARWGGEEFIIVFGGLREDAVASRMTRLLDDGQSLNFDLGTERPLTLTFSVGWTRHPLGATAQSDWAHALELADAALYQAKASGRNTWVGLTAGPHMGDAALGGHPGKRIAELVGEGRLQWQILRPRPAPVPRGDRSA